mgnify:CR=1 FL=1
MSLSEAYQYKKDSKDSKILLDRVKELESLFTGLTFPNITFSKMIYVKDPKTLRELFTDIINKGGEGFIWKKQNSVYHSGDTTDWGKLKNIMVLDLEIVGYEYGKARSKTEGLVSSVVCKSRDGKLLVSVGSGLTAWDYKNLTDNGDLYIGMVIEVIGTNLIKNKQDPNIYSVFLPRFSSEDVTGGYTNFEASIRYDKIEALTLKECQIAEKDCRLDLIFGDKNV